MTDDISRQSGEAESQHTDGSSEQVSGASGETILIGQVANNVVVNRPAPGEQQTVPTEPNTRYILDFNAADARVRMRENDFVLQFDDDGDGTPETEVVLADLVDAGNAENPAIVQVGGVDIPAAVLVGQALALADPTLEETAAGPDGAQPVQSGGGTAYTDSFGNVIGLLDRQDVIEGTELQFTLPDPEGNELLLDSEISTVQVLHGQSFEDGDPNQHIGLKENVLTPVNFSVTPPDGEELTSISISGIPSFITVFIGGAEVDTSSGTLTLTPADIEAGVAILLGENNSDEDIALTYQALFSDGSTNTITAMVTVDAVADQPTDVLSDADSETVSPGTPVTFTVGANFDDFTDGSEEHFILVQLPDGWTGPEGLEAFNVTAEQGALFGVEPGNYLFVPVPNGQIAPDGSASVQVTLTPPANLEGEQVTINTAAGAVETNLSGGEITLDNNLSLAQGNAVVFTVVSPEVEVLIGPETNELCIEEDSTLDDTDTNTVEVSANATNGVLTTLVISGLDPSWTYDFSGLETAGATLTDADPSDGSIAIEIDNLASFNGSFTVQPPADTDVDLGTITAEATAVASADSTVSVTGSDTTDVVVDANADPVTIDSFTVTPSEGETFQEGETGTVSLAVSFGDFTDGSETHEVVVTVPEGFTVDQGSLNEGLPEGVTASFDSETNQVTYSVSTNDGVGSFTAEIGVTNTLDGKSEQSFTVAASARETTTGDVECDPSDEDNLAQAAATVTTPVVNTEPPQVDLSLNEGVSCIQEDSGLQDPNNVVNLNATAGEGDVLTEIVISGLDPSWEYDFSGLEIAGATLTDADPGDGSITIELDNLESYDGSFAVQPPADSDVDLGTITAEATAVASADPTVSASATDSQDVTVDANADEVSVDSFTVTPNGGDTFQEGETGIVSLAVSFGDFTDGSETHEVVVTVPEGFTVDQGSLNESLPEGVTASFDSETNQVTYSVSTNDGVGSFTAEIGVTNTLDGKSEQSFTVTASARETTTGDVECDPSDEDNLAQAAATVTTPVVNTGPPQVDLSLNEGVSCIQEDSTTDDPNNVVNLNATAGEGDVLTQIVITGLDPSWTYNFSGLESAGATLTDADFSDGSITIELDNLESYDGSFAVQPPADSDVDLGTISAEATAVASADPSVSASATDSQDVTVDADADDVSVTSFSVTPNEGSTFQLGECGTVQFTATFGDTTDGSEIHTIVVNVPEGFTVNEATLDSDLPDGVTVSLENGQVTYVIDTTAGIDELTASFEVDNTLEQDTTADFSITARAEETTTGDVECDDSDEDNVRTDASTVTTPIVNVDPPKVDISVGLEGECLEEDSTTAQNQVGVSAQASEGDVLTQIVISGFDAGTVEGSGASDTWLIDLTNLQTAEVQSVTYDETSDTITITFNPGVSSYNANFGIAPPADSDVDLGALTAEATVVASADPSQTASATDSEDVTVDANADPVEITLFTVTPYRGTSFQPGECGTVRFTATFGDTTDGSETHTIVVDIPDSFTVNESTLEDNLPDGVTVTHENGQVIYTVDTTAGIDQLTTYFIVDSISQENTSADFSITATATETTTDDVECDPSQEDNVATDTATATAILRLAEIDTLVLNEVGLGVGGAQGDENYIELLNTSSDEPITAAQLENLELEIIGTDGNLVTVPLDFDSEFDLQPGNFLVLYEDGSFEVTNANGDVVESGNYAAGGTWNFGDDTSATLAVNLVQRFSEDDAENLSVDALLANGANRNLLSGNPQWNPNVTGANGVAAAVLGAAFAADYTGFDGDQFETLARVVDANVLPANGDLNSVDDGGTHIFSRVFGPNDGTPVDGNSEADWSTNNAPTEGAFNDAADDINPQDALDGGDDLNPAQNAGTNGADAGQTVLQAGDGNPELAGGLGQDVLLGDDGDNILRGGAHNDSLFGEGGNDQLYGERGADLLVDVIGTDLMVGGRGDDILIGNSSILQATGLGETSSDMLIGDQTSDANVPTFDIAFVLDKSGSMAFINHNVDETLDTTGLGQDQNVDLQLSELPVGTVLRWQGSAMVGGVLKFGEFEVTLTDDTTPPDGSVYRGDWTTDFVALFTAEDNSTSDAPFGNGFRVKDFDTLSIQLPGSAFANGAVPPDFTIEMRDGTTETAFDDATAMGDTAPILTLKSGFLALLESIQDEGFAGVTTVRLIPFAGSGEDTGVNYELTDPADLQALIDAINDLRPGGATQFESPLRQAAAWLEDRPEDSEKLIYFLSDGADNDDFEPNSGNLSARLQDLEVDMRVFGLTNDLLGNGQNLDPDQLDAVARAAGDADNEAVIVNPDEGLGLEAELVADPLSEIDGVGEDVIFGSDQGETFLTDDVSIAGDVIFGDDVLLDYELLAERNPGDFANADEARNAYEGGDTLGKMAFIQTYIVEDEDLLPLQGLIGRSDYIHGMAGDDFIHGQGGDDIIIGGLGNDTLWGGTGEDVFLYNSLAEGSSSEVIKDFNDFEGDSDGQRGDALDLSALLEGFGDGAADAIADFVRVQSGEVQVDTDGAGGDFQAVARVEGIEVGDQLRVIADDSEDLHTVTAMS